MKCLQALKRLFIRPERLLAKAEAIDPGNPFVAGCRAYFKRHGHLTKKQVAALARVRPTRHIAATSSSAWFPAEPHDFHIYGNG